jgi:hypothetical protein
VNTTATPLDALTQLEIARLFNKAGFNVIPLMVGRNKAPACNWGQYGDISDGKGDYTSNKLQNFHETILNIGWWSNPNKPHGIAVICGATSRGLCIFDIEFPEIVAVFIEEVEKRMPGLLAKLPQIETPGKHFNQPGRHFYCLVAGGARQRKLAMLTPEVAAEYGLDPKHPTLIEIKSRGGYVATIGNLAECHHSGRLYKHVEGTPPPWLAPELCDEEFSVLCEFALTFDARERVEKTYEGSTFVNDDDAPGTQFNARGKSMPQMLEEHGWVLLRSRGQTQYWRRPGKNAGEGHSATFGHKINARGCPMFYNFSSNDILPQAYIDAFGVYARLYHGGDFKAAAKALRAEGYGKAGRSTSVAGERSEPSQDDSTEASGPIAARLIELTRSNFELWHNSRGIAFATNKSKPKVTIPVRSRQFKQRLSATWYRQNEGRKALSRSANDTVVGTVEAIAIHDGPEREDHLRVASSENKHYLFLADQDLRSVEIDCNGWRIVDEVPVCFRKPQTIYPDPRFVVTPNAFQLSWLIARLGKRFGGKIDYMSKFEFYGRLANAAIRYQASCHAESARDLLLAVLHEAYAMVDELEAGVFEFLAVASGGEEKGSEQSGSECDGVPGRASHRHRPSVSARLVRVSRAGGTVGAGDVHAGRLCFRRRGRAGRRRHMARHTQAGYVSLPDQALDSQAGRESIRGGYDGEYEAGHALRTRSDALFSRSSHRQARNIRDLPNRGSLRCGSLSTSHEQSEAMEWNVVHRFGFRPVGRKAVSEAESLRERRRIPGKSCSHRWIGAAAAQSRNRLRSRDTSSIIFRVLTVVTR